MPVLQPVTVPGGSAGQFQYQDASGVFAGATGVVYATSGSLVTVTAQATTDTPLVLTAVTSQTGDIQRWSLSDGVRRTRIDSDGMLVIQPSISGKYGLKINDANGTTQFSITADAGGIATNSAFTSSGGYRITSFGAYVGILSTNRLEFPNGGTVVRTGATTNYGLAAQGEPSQTAPLFKTQLVSSTSTVRDVFDLTSSWVSSTDATRTSRHVFNVYDTAAREALRIEANGTNPLIGFLGATAVAQQSIGAAATDAATTQTLANNIRTLLINFGLGKT